MTTGIPEGTRAKRKPKAPKLGKCCKPMEIVLSRPQANGLGFVVGTRFSFSKRQIGGEALGFYFRRAKAGEPFPEVGRSFGWVAYCPFCGTPTEPQP